MLAISISGLAQTDWLKTSPIKVADGFGYHHPQIEISGDSRVLITWTDQVSQNAYIAKHNGVDGFMDPIQLNPSDFGVASYDWSGPDLAVEGENVYVVFRAGNYESYLVKSTDYGETFGDTVRLGSPDALFPFYPDVAVLNDTVYATYMIHEDEDGASPDYVFTRSVDGGTTFEAYTIVSELFSDEVCDCCPPEIVVNDDYVAVFFRNNDANIRDIKGVVSYDRGATFTEWFSVDDHGWFIAGCPSTGPDARFIGEDLIGSIYKTYEDGESKIILNQYDLSTGTVLDEQALTSSSHEPISFNYPQMNLDNERLGAVWEGFNGTTSLDIFFNGTLLDDFYMNPDNVITLTDLNGVQSKPDIAVKDGLFQVVYANSVDQNLYFLQVGESNRLKEDSQTTYQIYPNPAKDQFTFDNPGEKGTLIISDLSGKVMYRSIANHKTIISTHSWENGIYILRYSGSDTEFTTKLVVHER